jgi:uncharacterized protein Yka (UPF0111/DUF47 family)
MKSLALSIGMKSGRAVESIESNLDEQYFKTKLLFIKLGTNMNPAVLIILRDIAEFMERTADLCADTADHLRILAADEEKP